MVMMPTTLTLSQMLTVWAIYMQTCTKFGEFMLKFNELVLHFKKQFLPFQILSSALDFDHTLLLAT